MASSNWDAVVGAFSARRDTLEPSPRRWHDREVLPGPRSCALPGLLSVVALLLLPATACGPSPSLEDEAPIDVSLAPEQTPVEGGGALRTEAGGYEITITPVAQYVLRGVVLSRESYHLGWNGELSPCDLAVAWGDLAAGEAWRTLSWSQSGRWYFWRWSGTPPFPADVIVRNSSNTHLIPASRNLRVAVRALGRGDVVELFGELVTVEGQRGGDRVWWRSSLSRSDTGDGSCELLYLRRLRVDGKVYE